MVVVIEALDEEFAASTGKNIDSGTNTSTFDYPPTATKGLVITSNPDDPNPYTFEPGDTYDLSWGGMGGDTVLKDAVVIRSDPVKIGAESGHAVVFEGVNQDGEPVQLVWSPGFNLENWYFDIFNQGASPGFYTEDRVATEHYSYVCFAAGTRIAVPGGWRAVEALTPGDLVETVDHGPQPLVWVGQRDVSARGDMAPVCFAAGTLENEADLLLSPQHRLLYRDWRAEMQFGEAEVLLPAAACVGLPGVSQRIGGRVRYVHLLLARHEIVLAEQTPCESLFMGEVAMRRLRPPKDPGQHEAGAVFPEVLMRSGIGAMTAARRLLSMREAAALLDHAPPVPPGAAGRVAFAL